VALAMVAALVSRAPMVQAGSQEAFPVKLGKTVLIEMSEFEVALKTQGKWISPVLLDLGWQRKRIWSTAGHYHRYWVPPDTFYLKLSDGG
jgi:hypothetical protein